MPFDLYRIGQLLRAAREEKRLTLEEVSRTLFIRKRIIEAIETGDWETLPHPVYVKGYITQYASLLDMLGSVETEMPPRANTFPQAEETAASNSVRKVQTGRQFRKKMVGSIAMAVIVVGFLVFQNLPGPVYTPRVASQSVESNYQTVAAGAAGYGDQSERLVLESKKLMIACQERTWVRIVIDGSEKKELMMNPGEVVMLNGRDKFDLLVGNAGGVTLFYNGKDTGFTGEQGEVKRINLS